MREESGPIQIHDATQARRFVERWGPGTEVALARFETVGGGASRRRLVDIVLRRPSANQVFAVLGIECRGPRAFVFPEPVNGWPEDVLEEIAAQLRKHVIPWPPQYTIKALTRSGWASWVLNGLGTERVLPGLRDYRTLVNHLKRYAFVRQILRPGRVLECASGGGYGASMLLHRADVTGYLGVDASSFAVSFSRQLVGDGRARFIERSLSELREGGFENVLSLETLEHVPDPFQFMDELCDRLHPGGQMVVSVPSERWGGYHRNRFHLTNWNPERFKRFLMRRFQECTIFWQELSTLEPDVFRASEIRSGAPNVLEHENFLAVLRKPKRARPKRIVVQRDIALGDVVWTTPIVEALRRSEPDAELVVVTEYTDVFLGNPYADVVGAPKLGSVGDEFVDLNWAYEERRSDHILVAYAARAGLSHVAPRPKLYPDRPDFSRVSKRIRKRNWAGRGVEKVVAVHMAATSPDRIWPKRHWLRFLLWILCHPRWAVLVLGARKDHDPRRVPWLWPVLGPRTISLVGRTNLLETAAALSVADLLVCPDSGLSHVGAAVGTSTVVLYGMADPRTRLPLDGSGVGIWTDVPCRGCLSDLPPRAAPLCRLGKGKAMCYRTIRPARVIREVRAVLKNLPPGRWVARLEHGTRGANAGSSCILSPVDTLSRRKSLPARKEGSHEQQRKVAPHRRFIGRGRSRA